jgi:5'-nucleotidase
MRLLLSNDDGILAPGLSALARAVADLGEVVVVAPDSPQSAAGHAITLSHPLTVQRVQLASAGCEAYSVDGRPADCVRLAIKSLLPKPPDVVLSGINAGTNVGINVFYSGTVAAAAEATMCGIPAVAFSAATVGGAVDFDRIAPLCRWVLDHLPITAERADLFSVNIPALDGDRPRGVRVVRQSTAGLEDEYHRADAGEAGTSYRLAAAYRFLDSSADTDVAALAAGFITITPLRVDMTAHPQLEALQQIDFTHLPRQAVR